MASEQQRQQRIALMELQLQWQAAAALAAAEEMQQEHGWPSKPRTVVHEKASYMVTAAHDSLQQTFAAALEPGGFSSWLGGASESTQWLVKKWGDVYLHETAISHIRRLLDDDFACRRLGETVPQWPSRPGHAAAGALQVGLQEEGRAEPEVSAGRAEAGPRSQ